MTIPAGYAPSTYSGNGVTTAFALPQLTEDADDVVVTLTDAAGVNTVQSAYTVSGIGDPDGITVTMTTAPATGETLTIALDPITEQQTHFLPLGIFPAENTENALDRLTRVAQVHRQKINRSIRAPDTDAVLRELPTAAVRASQFAAFDSSGDLVVSSGTGADAGLRADLANTTTAGKGNELISYRRTPAEQAAGVTPTDFSKEHSPLYDAKRLGCTLDGTTDDYTALNNIITMASTTNIAVVIDGPMLVGTNITIPRNVQLWFVGNGKIKPAANKTITVNSKIQAGPWQIFDCSNANAVIAGSLGAGQVFVNWWGAVDDDLTDNGNMIRAAATSVAARTKGGIVYFPYTHSGIYRFTGTLYHYGNFVRFVAEGRGVSLVKTDTGTMLSASPTTHTVGTYTYYTNCTLENIYLSSSIADIGIDFSGYAYSTFKSFEILITGSNKKLLYGIGEQGSAPYYNLFDDFALFGNNNGSSVTGTVGIALEEGAWTGGSNGVNACEFRGIRRAASLDYLVDARAGNGNKFEFSGESIHQAYFRSNFRSADATGTASSGSANTLVDSGIGWTANEWVGCAAKITSGTGSSPVQVRRIASNTTDTLTFDRYWTVAPDNTSVYEIYKNKAGGNKITWSRGEGLNTSNPDFIQSYPGTYDTKASNYTVQSLGSGNTVVDDEKDPTNSFFDGDLITLIFLSTGLSASATTELTPAEGSAVFRGGYGLTGSFVVEAVEISCEGQSAGIATVEVNVNGLYSLFGEINTANPDYVYVVGNNTLVSGPGKKIHCEVVTDGSWAPTTADFSVVVLIRLLR